MVLNLCRRVSPASCCRRPTLPPQRTYQRSSHSTWWRRRARQRDYSEMSPLSTVCLTSSSLSSVVSSSSVHLYSYGSCEIDVFVSNQHDSLRRLVHGDSKRWQVDILDQRRPTRWVRHPNLEFVPADSIFVSRVNLSVRRSTY